ncbi:MAG TPA: T9SS type A sorting domain-containing protein, partial [Ignavibacteriaceae bacterium]
RLITDVDPRFWTAGDTISVSITAGIPADMEEGLYSAFIFLADPEPRIHDRADYAIRLANNNLWEDSTGYNYLNHQIKITNNAIGPTYTGTSFFELYTGVSGVQIQEPEIPERYGITAYPNPFNGTTTIEFNIRPQDVTEVTIFDIIGRMIRRFEPFEYTSRKIIWNTSTGKSGELSSGVYFVILKTKENLYSQKLLLLK